MVPTERADVAGGAIPSQDAGEAPGLVTGGDGTADMGEDEPKVIEIAPGVAHPARVYDYVAGGSGNFSADREAAEHASSVTDGGIDHARFAVRVHQDFVKRVVGHLAADAGIRQFLDVGSGIPTEDNTHGIAQGVAPESRVVYVDSDPVVLAHAHELRASTPEGATAFLDVDVRAPRKVLELAPATLDFGRPVAVMLLGVLYHVIDEDDPYGIVSTFMDAVAPGSYLVLSHLTADVMPEAVTEAARRIDEVTGFRLVLRSLEQVTRFFAGLEMVEPGVVPVDEWRPDREVARPEGWLVPFYGAVARKR